ncbi:MAG: MoaD/ThiS family protein [Phycisphaerales bacterium]|nr:MoaD/ThiS family protein [Phycisphaerales bacterium]
MRIRVTYTSQLRVAAGTSSESFEFESDATVRDVAHASARRHGERLGSMMLDETGAVLSWLMMSVNDQACFDADRPLADDDEVLFASPISGG